MRSQNGMCEVAFEKERSPAEDTRLTLTAGAFLFQLPVGDGSSTDDFIENKGPSGAAAFTNWLCFVVGADSGGCRTLR